VYRRFNRKDYCVARRYPQSLLIFAKSNCHCYHFSYYNGITFLACKSIAETLEEYCVLETFRPRCWKNEVILVEEAIYGRRQVGKCISSKEANRFQDPQYFGCYANVLDIVGRKCSGRRQCVINVPDSDLERTMPCIEGLKMFLEVRYSCVEGTQIN